jgi:NitT/TauT family transport system substrate-binding protein
MRIIAVPRRAAAACATLALVVCLAGASGAFAAPKAAKATGTTLTVGVQQSYSMLPLYVALRHGFFKQSGITDVKFTVFTSLPAMLTAVAQGQIDVGLQTIPAIVAFNRASSGAKLRIVAPISSGSLQWLGKTDSTIPTATKSDWLTTVKAWKGKKIGIPAPGGILALFTAYMVKEAGLQTSDVQLIPVGVGPPAVAALQAGVVDMVTGDAFTAGLLKAQGIGKTILSLLDTGPPEFMDSLTGVLFTTESETVANQQLYKGFADGLQKARVWIKNPKNKGDIQDILTRKIGLKREEVKALFADTVTQFTRPGTVISKKSVGATLKAYFGTGVMSGTQPGYDFFVADFAH